MSNKKFLMIMPVMKGGGAERVAALLTNEFHKNGYDCEFMLTSMKKDEAINRDLDSSIPLTSVSKKENPFSKFFFALLAALSSILCKPFEILSKQAPVSFAYLSFVAQYHSEIKSVRNKLKESPDTSVIAFLQPSIPITLLAAKNLPNRIVISERGDPKRQMKKRYGYKFIKKYYQRADAVVFQTNDAKTAYPENISAKGTVIFNPINDKLPEPYFGEREKRIVNFCRITPEKNLIMLIDAFADFHEDFDDYELDIFGDPVNGNSQYLEVVKNHIAKTDCKEHIHLYPARSDIHSVIRSYAMFTSSSDHEGMSNAMLEAMAIGMPVICTDCPIGGANAVIRNGENGILTEVGNAKEMGESMKKIAGNKELADKLSQNAAKIRNEMSLATIAKKWMELI